MKQSTSTAKIATVAKRSRTSMVLFVALAVIAGGLAWKFAHRETSVAAIMRAGDYVAARRLLEQKAATGDAWSQNQLGNIHYLGLGTPVDLEEAAKWYLRAALADWPDAQINIAQMYIYGRGVQRDVVRALAWLIRARSEGKEIAEVYVTWMFGSQLMTPMQLKLAKDNFRTLASLRPEGFE